MNHDTTEGTELDSGPSSPIGSRSNGSIDELAEHAAENHAGSKTAIRKAYRRTSDAMQSGYKRTLDYGTEHPERLGLATFAAGLGVATLFVATAVASRRTRVERIVTPLIDVVVEVARAVLRR